MVSRRQSIRTLQGCCGGVCAWILLVLESCGRAGGPVVLAECERIRFPRGEITEGFPQLVGFVARASGTVRAARCHLGAARGVPGGSFWCVHFELNRESALNFPPDNTTPRKPKKS